MIDQSSDITKFFNEIIVTKDKVAKIREYYTVIKNNIIDKYDELKISLENDIYWIQNKISSINALYSEILKSINNFTAKTSPPSLIVKHDKYLELMALYNKYIKEFYDRMNELYDIYKENFIKSKINDINDSWKFHYSENRSDASRIKNKCNGININRYSKILEISSGRYLLFNGENSIYDINNKTKDCYIINFDANTVNNIKNILQGSRFGLYSGDGAQIKSIFKVKNKDNIYVLIDLGATEDTTLFGQNDIIGTLEDGVPHILAIAKYDIVKKTISFQNVNNKTSTLIARNRLVIEEDFIIHEDHYEDFYYLQVGKYIVRLKVDGISAGDIESKIILSLNNKIIDMKIFNNLYLIVTLTQKTIYVYRLSEAISIGSPYKSVTTNGLALAQGDSGVINSIMISNDTVYFTTTKSLWYTTDLFTSLKRDDRIENIGASNIDLQDKSNYNMDTNDTFYYLHEHRIIYGVKKNDILTVSPTRYPERLLFLDNVGSLVHEGYLYEERPDLYQGENICFSYIEEDTYIGITTTGRVITGDIESGTLNPIKNSLTGNNTVTAALLDNITNILYLATNTGLIYTLDKSAAYENNPHVTLLQATDMGSIYSMCIYKDVLYIAGYVGRVSSYGLKTNIYYSYNEYFVDYITNTGTAIGNVNIRTMAVVAGNLVIAGNAGRIASCNLVTKKWTRFNGTSELDGSTNIDALIFNNGSALGNFDITAMYNHLNKYLIIFGINGRIASYDIALSSWTDYTGIPLNSLNPGLPIYSIGGHSNGSTVRSVLLTNKGLVLGSDRGYISSLNPETGGITRYDGIQIDVDNPGPGISFDSYEFEHDILSLALDVKRNNIILGTRNSCIATYNINEKDLLFPIISKLYYIAKRDTKHDYLSSFLAEISKETLFEKRTIYPPREENDIYEYGYDTYFYVYKNGPFIYKLSSTLEDLEQSVNDGETFTSYHISNKTWSLNNKIDKIKGYVAKDGTFVLYAVINDIPYLLITYQDGAAYSASWYTIDLPTTEAVLDMGLIDSNFVNRYLFYLTISDSRRNIKYPVIISVNNNALVLLRHFLTNKTSFDDENTTLLQDTIHVTMDSEGRVLSSNEKYLNIFEWDYIRTGLNPELSGEPAVLIKDYSLFMQRLFIARKKDAFLNIDNSIRCFLGFYALPNNIFNLIYAGRNGNIIIITVYVQKDRYVIINNDSMLNSENWTISLNEIQACEYLSVYANNLSLQNNYQLSEITIDKSYLVLFQDNIRGLLGLNVSYYERYNPIRLIRDGYKEQHVIISLDCEVYKNHIAPEYRVYKNISGKGIYVSHNKESNQVLIATYKDKIDGYIPLIRNIYKLTLVNSSPYSPLRALTDYWYNHKVYMHNDINAVRIRAKVSQLENDSFKDSIDKQFSFRYEVLVTNETDGNYILYEAEKSTITSRVDNDTKTFNTFLRVKAIDGFEDDIIELYNSRISGRQVAFTKAPNQNNIDTDYLSKSIISYDFTTIIQLGEKNRESSLIDPSLYSIKIRPLSNIPSTVDVQFYIEPYKNNGSYGIAKLNNNIKRSEFKAVDFVDSNGNNEFYYFSKADGFISETSSNAHHIVDTLHTTNHELYAQYDSEPAYRRNGFADTLVSFIKGRGHSRYDRVDGIVSNIGYNTWSIIPYSVNRKPITYYFDSNGTKNIQDNFDIEFLKNGRNITKMHEFGVFSPNIINISDYYTDLKNNGRIVKHEGLLATPYGLYEGIGTLDGRQKRITGINESQENSIYRYTNHSLDDIYDRLYGHGYDFIDRYTIYEIPYYYIRAWWIPARGYIKRSNESLLTLDNDEVSNFDTIGQALFPFDFVSPPPSISKPDEENAGGGIGSGGMAADPNIVAFSTLILEKFPLEHWEGYNDLDFVRFYKDIYMDGHEEDRIDIEPPREIIPRNLYHYEDNLDWERRGKEVLKYLTGYYYNRFDWKIYYHEVREITSGYNSADTQFLTSNPKCEHLLHDYNASTVLQDVFTEEKWYVNEKPVGSGAWPINTTEIVGERIINMTNPLVDMVAHLGSMPYYTNNSNNVSIGEPNKAYIKIYRRGLLYDSIENITYRGHTMVDLLNPVASRKRLSPLTITPADTHSGIIEPIVSRIDTLNTFTDKYLALIIGQDALSIPSQLREAFRKIGIASGQILGSARYRHIILGSSKLTSGMIEYLDPIPASYYSKGYGYIAPIRLQQWNYADIENTNENTPWVATIKKYRADCYETTENRNMVLTKKDKYYDRYVGLGTHKYLYATEYDVSMQLSGINPRLHKKTFYYYTVEGSGTSYYNQFTHWWDHRPPTGITTSDIVEREYTGRTEPYDEYKRVVYHIREWLNNGTYRDVEEHYDFYIKWLELNDDSVLTIPIADESGEYFDDYQISGIERYEFYDGTILTVPRTHTMASLRSNFGVTINLEVVIDSTPDNPYYIRRKISFSGLKIDDGGSNFFERTWSTTATYTEVDDSPSGALKNTTTGTRILRWQN